MRNYYRNFLSGHAISTHTGGDCFVNDALVGNDELLGGTCRVADAQLADTRILIALDDFLVIG